MQFVGQGFQKLDLEQDRQTDKDRRDWTYYHDALRLVIKLLDDTLIPLYRHVNATESP